MNQEKITWSYLLDIFLYSFTRPDLPVNYFSFMFTKNMHEYEKGRVSYHVGPNGINVWDEKQETGFQNSLRWILAPIIWILGAHTNIYVCMATILISYSYMCFPRDRIARMTHLNIVYFYTFCSCLYYIWINAYTQA